MVDPDADALPPGATGRDRRAMLAAVAEAERARGSTGDNPWVGSVIVDGSGEVVAAGHTQGPGEDHAEIVALRAARARGVVLAECTLYSTLEPCSFHGRTPACARAIGASGVRRVVTGIRDPNPRVDGLGLRLLQEAGLEVIEGVAAHEITVQLASWIFRHHPHEPLRRASLLSLEPGMTRPRLSGALCRHYGLPRDQIEALLDLLGNP